MDDISILLPICYSQHTSRKQQTPTPEKSGKENKTKSEHGSESSIPLFPLAFDDLSQIVTIDHRNESTNDRDNARIIKRERESMLNLTKTSSFKGTVREDSQWREP
jgi:hypothetical protein